MSAELPVQEALFELDDEQVTHEPTVTPAPESVPSARQAYAYGFNNFIDAAPRTEVNARAQGRVIE